MGDQTNNPQAFHDDVIQRNIFRVIVPLWREATGDRWIPLTQAGDTELWCFLWSVPEKNSCAINQDTVDLRRRRAHYDVTVMLWCRLFGLHNHLK